MADNILVLVSLCFCLPRSLVLALCTLRCLHLYAEGGPSLFGYEQKSATPLTAPSYFIRAPVLASRLPPLGTAKSIRASLGYCNRNHTKQSCCIWLSDNGVVCFLIFFR